MQTYNEIEIAMGHHLDEPGSDSDEWEDFKQARRRTAIMATELDMAKTIDPLLLPKLLSPPINLTDMVSSDILTPPEDLAQLHSLWHDPASGRNVFFTGRDNEWHELQDGINFTNADPYYFMLGNKTFQLEHDISSPSLYMKYIQFPQTHQASFDYGDQYTQFDGREEIIILGASARLLTEAKQFETAKGLYKLYYGNIKTINGG